MNIEQFRRDRDAALLSLNEDQIREFCKNHGDMQLPRDPDVFWRAVHKAITGATSLPLEFRKSSKAWLTAHHSESLDDGELS